MAPVPSSTPHGSASTARLPRDLVPVIARHLEELGEYRMVVDSVDTQLLVDVQWAALEASRALGRRVRVLTSRAADVRESPIAVLVTFEDRIRRPIPQQRTRF
jgi:hypothetical protein